METKSDFPNKVIEYENVWIPMTDGTRLAARMWLPEHAEMDPVPAILEYLPYRKRDGTTARDALTHPYFAGHNFACVRVDIRGNGESDGLMEDEYTLQEQLDGVAVIEWIAKQSWCSGNVGIMGISWGGFNGLQLAALNPPALKAVVTLCSTDDRYADDIHYKGGCLLNENLGWGATMLSYSSRPPDPKLAGENWRELWLERLKNQPFLPAVWLSHQTRDAYWENGSICEDYSAIKAAVLTVGGWGDAYKNPVFRMLENLDAPTKAIVGPWVHKYPHFAVPHPQIGFLQEALKWWNRWLRDEEAGVEQDPRYRGYVMDWVPPSSQYTKRPGRWIKEESWPSGNIHQTTLKLSDKGLSNDGNLSNGVDLSNSLKSGADGGEYCAIWLGAEWAGEQSQDDLHSTTFDSEPLGEPFEIVGAPQVRLTCRSDKPRAQIAVRLCCVAPDGSSHRITYGVLNLCHKDSHSKPKLLTVDQAFDFRVKLDDVAFLVPKGHRLRLSMSTAYWPLIWPSPEDASVSVESGEISIPKRIVESEGDEVTFLPAEGAPAQKIETLREGSNSRNLIINQGTQSRTLEIVDDFGEVRDLLHGLVYGSIARESWFILPEDRNSARGDIHWTQTIQREGVRLRTEAKCAMWSDAQNFYMTANVEAFENDELFHNKNWSEEIPREFL